MPRVYLYGYEYDYPLSWVERGWGCACCVWWLTEGPGDDPCAFGTRTEPNTNCSYYGLYCAHWNITHEDELPSRRPRRERPARGSTYGRGSCIMRERPRCDVYACPCHAADIGEARQDARRAVWQEIRRRRAYIEAQGESTSNTTSTYDVEFTSVNTGDTLATVEGWIGAYPAILSEAHAARQPEPQTEVCLRQDTPGHFYEPETHLGYVRVPGRPHLCDIPWGEDSRDHERWRTAFYQWRETHPERRLR